MKNNDEEILVITSQEGPQTEFLSTHADIAFYGGAAGGGKSFGLLLDAVRHYDNGDFSGVIFRRERPMITNPGALWDESQKLFRHFDAEPNISKLKWKFPSGMTVQFDHLFHEDDKLNWQGSQIPFIGFDEVTHFTRTQFFYLISRARSTSGVPGHIRATCNPDPDSWVAEFISWWIGEDGFPIKERSGKLRWFIRQGEEFVWANTRKELIDQYGDGLKVEGGCIPLSVTFISAKITDNKILLKKDPTYLANLHSLNRVDRARLLDGNWKTKASAGDYFNRSMFEIVDAVPSNIVRRIRYWDRASTKPSEQNPNPDWTVGLKLSVDGYGTWYVEHVCRFRDRPLVVKETIKKMATQDGFRTQIGIEQDPGQAGVAEADDLVRFLRGHVVRKYPVTKAKEVRAKPVSSQAEAGNIKVVRGPWNEAFFNELESFPPAKDKGKDDQVAAFSGAFNALNDKSSTLQDLVKM